MSEEANSHTTLASLAKALGFSSPALSGWKRKFADCPQTLVESDWREFIARRGLGHVGNRVGKSREALLQEKLETEIRLNRIKISQQERKLIPADDVDSFLLYVGARVRSALYQMTSELPPKLAGLEAPEIRRMMRESADVICVTMQGAHGDWKREQDEAARAAQLAEHDDKP